VCRSTPIRALAILHKWVETTGAEMNETRLHMTRIPKGADLILNKVSGAPGSGSATGGPTLQISVRASRACTASSRSSYRWLAGGEVAPPWSAAHRYFAHTPGPPRSGGSKNVAGSKNTARTNDGAGQPHCDVFEKLVAIGGG
jgi:hypothetical protein